jgi:predicted ABC-type ATPase
VGPPSRDLGLASPDERRAENADQRPLTSAELAERVGIAREWLGWARRERLATDDRYQDEDGTWSPERQDAHDAIVNDLYNAAAEVPCDREAIMAGGLGGAGKTTVLDRYADVDRSKYLTINPDNIKEEMAKRGLIPELDGLSPMEASDLVHEESSAIARMLGRRAMADGKNVIWDITMSSPDSALSRLDVLDAKGYSTRGIFVDITIDEAVTRADARHRAGHERYRAGIGYGGRYVPPEVIRAQTDPEWGSINRRIFEQVKSRFTDWAVYDNNGAAPQLVEVSKGWNPDEER